MQWRLREPEQRQQQLRRLRPGLSCRRYMPGRALPGRLPCQQDPVWQYLRGHQQRHRQLWALWHRLYGWHHLSAGRLWVRHRADLVRWCLCQHRH
jgi:hypothetical protein